MKTDELQKIELSDNARNVLMLRYVRKDEEGNPAETIEEMFWRVASTIASVESKWDQNVEKRAIEFYNLLISKRFFPNSPTFTGAGTPLGQLAACFVLPIEDDMGKYPGGIFQTLRDSALVQQAGGGVGFSFSRIRPRGSLVASSNGQATGPIGFLRTYSTGFTELGQGGVRRAAGMAVLRVDHPDIEEFIECKKLEGQISSFNISVGITDKFMSAVKSDELWDLKFLDLLDPAARTFKGTIDQAEKAGIPIRIHKRIRARELFDKIVDRAYSNGEPGVLFLDTANAANPVPNIGELETTNPCGEQFLLPNENCCLGSINLAEHVVRYKQYSHIDWGKLEETIILATIFLDDTIDANMFVPAVPQLKEAAMKTRRIGLGIMGLADLLYELKCGYNSPEGRNISSQIMEFVRYISMRTSVDLAKIRGTFPAIKGSVYDPDNFTWSIPYPLKSNQYIWKRPDIYWIALVQDIKKYGIRNAAQTTVAPTGTIATVAGCEGYGCEPVFALAYKRYVTTEEGTKLTLKYLSPIFEDAMNRSKENGLSSEDYDEIMKTVLRSGSCRDVLEKLPPNMDQIFVVSSDISVEDHILMQATLQKFVDNSISKTITLPNSATKEDVEKAYMLAWKLGCKGITVYRTGSREKVVLETEETNKNKNKDENLETDSWHKTKLTRPDILSGTTSRIDTPLGKLYLTINNTDDGQPFEVFITASKAGSDTFALADALGRLLSYILRMKSSVEPKLRLEEVIDQLQGIGGARSLGFGPNRVKSLPDAIATLLTKYLKGEPLRTIQINNSDLQEKNISADLCPSCGEATMINEEGCSKCYSCGHSEC